MLYNITAAINCAAGSTSSSAWLQLLETNKVSGNMRHSPWTGALAYHFKSRGAHCDLQPDHVAVPTESLPRC